MKIQTTLLSFDAFKNNPDISIINRLIFNQVSQIKPLELVIFTCSTITDRYLFDQDTPWRYVSLNPAGNNLEADLPALKKLIGKIAKIYPTKLTIIIGNTDPYYIYSQSFSIYQKYDKATLWKNFARCWRRYQNNLTAWLKNNGLTNFEVISWYEFEAKLTNQIGLNFETLFNQLLPQISRYFPVSAFSWEARRLTDAFGKGKYFPTLPIPDKNSLAIWIKRKFTEYMLQGFFIKTFFPNAILLQNEKPSILRTSMYQPLIQKYLNSRLPVIYPFGIDNLNYQ